MRNDKLYFIIILFVIFAILPTNAQPVSATPEQVAVIKTQEPQKNPQWIATPDSLSLIWETTVGTAPIPWVNYYIFPPEMRNPRMTPSEHGQILTWDGMDNIPYSLKALSFFPYLDPEKLQPPFLYSRNQEPHLELRYVAVMEGDNREALTQTPHILSVVDWGRGLYPAYQIFTDGKQWMLNDSYDYYGPVETEHPKSDNIFRPLTITTKPIVTINLGQGFKRFPPRIDYSRDRGEWGEPTKGFEELNNCQNLSICCSGDKWELCWNSGNEIHMSFTIDAGKTWQKPCTILRDLPGNPSLMGNPSLLMCGDHMLMVAREYSFPTPIFVAGYSAHSGPPMEGWYDDPYAAQFHPTQPMHGKLICWQTSKDFTAQPKYSTLVADEDVTGYDVKSDGKNNVYLVYTRGNDQEHSALRFRASHDGGVTWEDPEQLTDGKMLDRFPVITLYHKALWVAFERSEKQGANSLCYLCRPLGK